jgi:hypothetical protein
LTVQPFRRFRATAALLSAAVVACTAVLVAAPPAAAHDLPVGVHNVLDRVDPRIDGITVQVVRTIADQLVVENRTANDLEVLAPTAEPFLRIGPQGVFANLNSPSWYLSSSGLGTATVPERAHVGATPEWAKIATAPSWGWFDHRLHPASIPGPKGSAPQRLASWNVAFRYNGNRMTVRGHLEFRIPRGSVIASVPNPSIAPGVAVAVLPGRLPGLFLTVTSPATVIVEGERGEPFVRATAKNIEVNEASPTWTFTAAARNVIPDGPVDATAPPRWTNISGGGRVSWLEPRARYAPGEPRNAVQQRAKRVVISHWTVPVTVDGVRHEIAGLNEWVPTATRPRPAAKKDASRGPWYAAIGLGLGSIALAIALRRRRVAKMSA